MRLKVLEKLRHLKNRITRPTKVRSKLTGAEYDVLEWYEWDGFIAPRLKSIGTDSPPKFGYNWPQDYEEVK